MWFYKGAWQPTFTKMQQTGKVKFKEGLPSLEDLPKKAPDNSTYVIVLDDLMNKALKNPIVMDINKLETFFLNIFTRVPHRNFTCIFLTQNIFHEGKNTRSVSRSASHNVMFLDICNRKPLKHLLQEIYNSPQVNALRRRILFHASKKPYYT